MSKSFKDFLKEYSGMGAGDPYMPGQRVQTQANRANQAMARDERRAASQSQSPTKSLDVQIANLKMKIINLTKKRDQMLRREQQQQVQNADRQGTQGSMQSGVMQ